MRSEQNMPVDSGLNIIQGLLRAARCKAIQTRAIRGNVLSLDFAFA